MRGANASRSTGRTGWAVELLAHAVAPLNFPLGLKHALYLSGRKQAGKLEGIESLLPRLNIYHDFFSYRSATIREAPTTVRHRLTRQLGLTWDRHVSSCSQWFPTSARSHFRNLAY